MSLELNFLSAVLLASKGLSQRTYSTTETGVGGVSGWVEEGYSCGGELTRVERSSSSLVGRLERNETRTFLQNFFS